MSNLEPIGRHGKTEEIDKSKFGKRKFHRGRRVEGYTHLTVNHSIEFVDSKTGACTNKIKSSWNAAKRTIDASGRRKEFFPLYLAKYMFQKIAKIHF